MNTEVGGEFLKSPAAFNGKTRKIPGETHEGPARTWSKNIY